MPCCRQNLKDKIFDQFRELSKKKRDEVVADAKAGKITDSIESWGELLAGVDQADSLKWAAWVDSLVAVGRELPSAPRTDPDVRC